MSGFRLPGIVWTVVLVALPLLAAWLEQYFGGAQWVAPIAGLLLIIAKLIEVGRASAQPPPGVAAAAAPPPSRTSRALWG